MPFPQLKANLHVQCLKVSTENAPLTPRGSPDILNHWQGPALLAHGSFPEAPAPAESSPRRHLRTGSGVWCGRACPHCAWAGGLVFYDQKEDTQGMEWPNPSDLPAWSLLCLGLAHLWRHQYKEGTGDKGVLHCHPVTGPGACVHTSVQMRTCTRVHAMQTHIDTRAHACTVALIRITHMHTTHAFTCMCG